MLSTISDRRPMSIGYFASFAVLGSATAILGPSLPTLSENTNASLSQASLLFVAFSLGHLVGSYQGGRLYDRMPGHLVMALGLLIMSSVLAVIPLAQLFWILVTAVAILGAAGGAVDVGGNTLLVWLHGRGVNPFMNALHFFFGLGGFLAPMVVAQVLAHDVSSSWAYWTLCSLALAPAFWLFRLPSPTARSDSGHEFSDRGAKQSALETNETLLIALVTMLLLLYVGAETGFGGWIYTYAITQELSDETTAAYLTSAFWGALTLGRLVGIPIATRLPPRWILLIDLTGCLTSLGFLLLKPQSLAIAWLGTCGLGLSMASVFPAAISFAGRRVATSGRTTAWFLVGGGIGGMTVPWLIGQLFHSIGPLSAMVVIAVVLCLATVILALVMLLSSGKLCLCRSLLYNGNGNHLQVTIEKEDRHGY